MLVRLRDLESLVPVVFWQSKRPQDQINEDTKEGIALARRFLDQCPGTEPVCEVKAELARFLFARGRRQRDEVEKERHQKIKESGAATPQMEAAWAEEKLKIEQEMKGYYKEIDALAHEAADCKASPKARQMGSFVLLKLAEQEFRLEEVRGIGRSLLEESPDFPFAPSVHISMASSYLAERRYKEAVDYLRAVIEKRENDLEYVVYNDRLFDALMGLGDLEGMEELAQRIRAEYPERRKTLDVDYYQSLYEQWYYNALFWIGYVRMALGDAEGAKAAFRESIAEVEALEARLKAEEKVLNNVIKVYLDNRTRDLLHYLEDLHGNPPTVRDAKGDTVMDEKGVARPLDFDLGAFWATEDKLLLKDSRGKVVAAIFHTKGFHEDRSKPFLQAIDLLVKERGGDGLRGVWLSFLTGRGGLEEDMRAIEALRDERKALAVSLPAGYDPDRAEQRLFRSLNATVGSASFFVFDRKGRYAWYMSDPLGRDIAVARRVIARILAEE
jgi:tetratricopeptide (TPR) repeat protein